MHDHIQHKKYGAGMRIGAYKRVNIIINKLILIRNVKHFVCIKNKMYI